MRLQSEPTHVVAPVIQNPVKFQQTWNNQRWQKYRHSGVEVQIFVLKNTPVKAEVLIQPLYSSQSKKVPALKCKIK